MKYPSEKEIDKVVNDFISDLNVSEASKKAVAFGFQEGLYKMIEILKGTPEKETLEEAIPIFKRYEGTPEKETLEEAIPIFKRYDGI